jgi:hypothetical protein
VVFIFLPETTEIAIYNMGTIKYRSIIRADAEYDYLPVKWDNTGLSDLCNNQWYL